ncbi:hypothetical protein DL764_008243 [Monosporascus ibericus]|uniref:Myb-like domain-containing protein n=1 Tax=Monosporascus ibericus TaxID=155417 RepID=A0A4Q4SY04_9PEZI|nr:hypothetical protein DL764_008243 [Monosporascus ibericus]
MPAWSEKADRDLVFAILLSMNGGKVSNVKWDDAERFMNEWGHTEFTRDAMNQRWSKKIYKDFRESREAAGDGGAAAQPSTPAPKTPGSAKRGRKAKGDDDDVEETPTKKQRKVPAKKAIKKEKSDGEDGQGSPSYGIGGGVA